MIITSYIHVNSIPEIYCQRNSNHAHQDCFIHNVLWTPLSQLCILLRWESLIRTIFGFYFLQVERLRKGALFDPCRQLIKCRCWMLTWHRANFKRRPFHKLASDIDKVAIDANNINTVNMIDRNSYISIFLRCRFRFGNQSSQIVNIVRHSS